MAAELPTTLKRPTIPSPEQLQASTVAQLQELHSNAQASARNAMGYLSLVDKLRRTIAEELLRRQREDPGRRARLVEFAKSWLKMARHVDGVRHVSASISPKI